MEDLAQLHPVAQVIAVIGISVFACVFVWQFWKTMREN